MLEIGSENSSSWKQNLKKNDLTNFFLVYMKMEHKKSWIKKLMKESHNDNSFPVHIEQSHQLDAISF